MGMKVAKFGGSSLADAAQFKKVREILFSDADRRIVVPSAPGKRGATDIKVTDLFYQCNRLAASGSDFAEAFDTIRARYREIAQELELTVDLDGYLDEVSRNIQLGAGADYAASRGEYLNGILLADYLGWDFIDPQQGIFFDEAAGQRQDAGGARPPAGRAYACRCAGFLRLRHARQRQNLFPRRQRHHGRDCRARGQRGRV